MTRVVSADWVVPVEGAPIADGAVAIADDGTIAAVGAAADLGRGEHFEGCVITPGFVNAHSHIEYAVYAGFGDGLPFVPWIGMHIQRKAALALRGHGRDRNRGGARVPAVGRDDDRGLQLLGRRRDRRGGHRPARDRLPRGLLERRAGARAVPRVARAHRERYFPTACSSASPRTRRTPARSRPTARAPTWAFPRRLTSPRAPRSATGSSTERGTGARWRSSSCRRPARPESACWPRRACSAPA